MRHRYVYLQDYFLHDIRIKLCIIEILYLFQVLILMVRFCAQREIIDFSMIYISFCYHNFQLKKFSDFNVWYLKR